MSHSLSSQSDSITVPSTSGSEKKVSVGVVGSTGYVGVELVRLLAQHPQVQLKALTSNSYVGQDYGEVYGSFQDLLPADVSVCQAEEMDDLAQDVDVIFVSLPHGMASAKVTPEVLEQAVVIDMGADFRLKDVATYQEWYKTDHHHPELLNQAVYGLTEYNREALRSARLIANPGCYPTCTLLTVLPAVLEGFIDPATLIIDAKSGVSGAGRSVSLGTHFNEVNESIKAYGLPHHRHTPEIEQVLSQFGNAPVPVSFTPHLIPMQRGILVTAYGQLNSAVSIDQVRHVYKARYGSEPMVRILPDNTFPQTRWVKGSNRCDIGVHVDERTHRLVMVGAIDNLMKGAASQAIQNMNVALGLREDVGITQIPTAL